MKIFTNFRTWSTRTKNAAAAVLFLCAYTVSMVAPFVPTQQVSAAQVCINDQQGANDLSGQKDLTRMCKDNANLPTSQDLVWNWDDTGWTGSNTGDACALYDTDNDGFANYSVCVTVRGTPAVQAASSPRIYSCNDNSVDKCFSATSQALNGTTCSVSITATQPFGSGTGTPNDTTATCTVTSVSVGGATASLIDVCSYPSQQPNSDPSDCIISKGGGKIEVKKTLSPASDLGTFNLSVAGTVYATGGDGTTTGERAVTKGVTEFRETAAAGSSLTNYNISAACKSANGTGSALTVTTIDIGKFSVNVPEDSDIVCTITNTRKTGTVTLIKNVTNNNGGQLGANDFGLTIGGTAVASGQVVSLPAGVSVAINEAGATGYDFVSITGDPYKCPTALGGTVTPVSGQNITCTITNDDKPATLIVNKIVVNDNGGTKVAQNFSYTVNNGNPTAFEADGSNSQTVNAGTYSVAEVAATGYTTTYTNSLNSAADCANLVIPNGGTATCIIKNDDQPAQLTLVKNLVNDNGGTAVATDWTLNAAGPTPISGATGNIAVTGANVSAGTYSLSETGGASGYTASDWVCVGGTQNGASVTLTSGQRATCTITNNDNSPYLQLIKTVTNDNGGTAENTAWTLIATGKTSATSFQGTTGIDSSSVTNFLAGSYTLSETGPGNYTSGNWSCIGGSAVNGVLELILGQSAVCTINNDDDAPKLTLNKVVTNDNGGTAVESDWTLTADGGTAGTLSGAGATGSNDVVSGASFKAGTYTLSESAGPSGYTASAWSCTGKTVSASNQITINLGDDVTCTITNDDNAPVLKLQKKVVNTYGGTAVAADWTLTATNGNANADPKSISGAGSVTSGSSFDAGSYTLSEAPTNVYSDVTDGYTASKWVCNKYELDGNTVRIALGQTVTCEITNSDTPGSIVGKKSIVNADGTLSGDQSAAEGWMIDLYAATQNGDAIDWSYLTSTTTEADGSYSFNNLVAGLYKVVEVLKSGWTQIFGGESSFSVGMGETYGDSPYESSAAFGNFKNGSISGYKFEDLDGNAEWGKSEPALAGWTIVLKDSEGDTIKTAVTTTEGYEFSDLLPGVYAVCEEASETQADAWLQTYPASSDGCYEINIDVSGEENTAINFGNMHLAQLTIVKDVQPDSTKAFTFKTDLAQDELGGDLSFSLTDDGSNLGTNMKKFESLMPGTYTITEVAENAWKLDDIVCTGTGVTMTRDGAKLTVTLAAGAAASCTFVNSFIPQVLAETYTLANTGTSVIMTSLIALLTVATAICVVLYRRRPLMETVKK